MRANSGRQRPTGRIELERARYMQFTVREQVDDIGDRSIAVERKVEKRKVIGHSNNSFWTSIYSMDIYSKRYLSCMTISNIALEPASTKLCTIWISDNLTKAKAGRCHLPNLPASNFWGKRLFRSTLQIPAHLLVLFVVNFPLRVACFQDL